MDIARSMEKSCFLSKYKKFPNPVILFQKKEECQDRESVCVVRVSVHDVFGGPIMHSNDKTVLTYHTVQCSIELAAARSRPSKRISNSFLKTKQSPGIHDM
jgi:hypothetical protein